MGLTVLPFLFTHAILLLMCFILASSNPSRISGNETDRLALLEFKAKVIQDPFGVFNSWNDSVHFCQWHGITCSSRHQRVTTLDLESMKLVGSISPHIGNLSFLRYLYLYNNSFSHEIPPEIGRLRRLRILYIHGNSLSGTIPTNLSSCSNLAALSFARNQLVGEIPRELGSLSKLRFFSLNRNNLTGIIPFSLWNLSSLATISLNQNGFHGSVPDSLGQLKSLKVVYFGDNKLSGKVPTSILNLSSIVEIDLGVNQFQGNLPSDVFTSLPNLRIFSVARNQLTGSIPISLSNATNLEELQLNENGFTGEVPSLEKLVNLTWFFINDNNLGTDGPNDLKFLSSLTNATTLELLNMGSNNFGGILPDQISQLSGHLRILCLHNNQISGSIPPEIEKYNNLELFYAWGNRLSGSIPSSIGQLQNLQDLDLSINNFTLNITPSLGNLANLFRLILAGNELEGSIPSSLGQCNNLQELDLSQNNLSGSIPSQLLRISALSTSLNLSQNHLTGSLPDEVGNLVNLGQIDLSGNKLSGQLPTSLDSCVRIEVLNLRGNLFNGSIHSSLRSMRGLRVLDLSENNFSGEIPQFLADFDSFQSLNLSYNDFNGMVPTEGVFKNSSAISVTGNNKLCGGIQELKLPLCQINASKPRLKIKLILIISLVCALLGFALGLYFLYVFLQRKKKDQATSNNFSSSLLKVSFGSILKATNEFSSENLIGAGSFGSVYKGILEDGAIIAVKVLNLLRQGASKSFIAECEALRNIRHRNLVKVLSACSGVDYHGNDFKALVYDFMVNGSLESWLHPSFSVNEAHETPRELNLLQRLNIAIDVACALEYLHHHCEAPIVHCDLKPSNVLLDSEMIGHVGDFGLARFIPEATSNSASGQTSSIGLRGSIGYAAPEYGTGSEVSTYGDLYSYGILVLEMFTGKRPTDEIFVGGLNLHNFVKASLPDHTVDISDPALYDEICLSNMHNPRNGISGRPRECLISILGIGVACSAELPRDRMSISDAVVQLRLIRDKLLATGRH